MTKKKSKLKMLESRVKTLEPILKTVKSTKPGKAAGRIKGIEDVMLESLLEDGFHVRVEAGRFIAEHPTRDLDEHRRMGIEANQDFFKAALRRHQAKERMARGS